MKSLGVSLLIALSLCSCYVTQPTGIKDALDSSIGRSEHEIILEYGPPVRITSDGSSGKILIYESSRHRTLNLPGLVGDSPYYPMFSATASRTSYVNFFVNEDSKVYYWRTNYPLTEEVIDEKKSKRALFASAAVLFILLGVALSL